MSRVGLSGRNLSQQLYEFDRFLDMITKNEITSYLEIGCRHGDSFYEIVSSMPKGSKAVAIDLPNDAWGMKDSKQALIECVDQLIYEGYDVKLLFANSTHQEAIDFATKEGPFGCVFLDGDHRYEGIKADYENYGLPLATKLIAFHDIAEVVYNAKHKKTVEVKTLWDEIKHDHKDFREIIWYKTKFLMGIGILEL